MKKNIFVSTILILLLSTSSYAQSGWGSWRETDCLKGLDFRVKRGDYNEYAEKYKWHIEFRNRYYDNIHFSCKAVEPSRRSEIRSSGKTTDRTHANANGGTSKVWFLVNSSSDIYVHINKIRINDKDWGVNYYDCDK